MDRVRLKYFLNKLSRYFSTFLSWVLTYPLYLRVLNYLKAKQFVQKILLLKA